VPDLFGYSHYECLTRSAEISECGTYRYWLRRSWKHGGDGSTICFVMLNPSTADALVDDPTIRRCMSFARLWRFSVLSVRNLYAVRATDPKDIWSNHDPVGPKGDVELLAAKTADVLVVAWGIHAPEKRERAALEMFAGKQLWCLGVTKAGHPRHPLYVAGNQPLVKFPVEAPHA
jgi:hypothetical protein